MSGYKPPRCPGCKGPIVDNDWTDHLDCLAMGRHHETEPDPEPKDPRL